MLPEHKGRWSLHLARVRELNKGLIHGGASFRIRKSFETAYRPDLSRFPNDPDAHVSGPDSLNRLIEKRKRAGWIVGKPGSLADVDVPTMQPKGPERDLFAESLREAKEICGET